MRFLLLLFFSLYRSSAGQTPDCMKSFEDCIYSRTSEAFADSWRSVASGVPLQDDAARRAACDREGWQKYTSCLAQPPLTLSFKGPPELTVQSLVGGPLFPPAMKVFGRELQVETLGDVRSHPGDQTRFGCSPSDYIHPTKNYTGKAVMIETGGCTFIAKGQSAFSAGVALLISLGVYPGEGLYGRQMEPIPRPDHPELGRGTIPLQLGNPLMDAIDAGAKVTATLTTNCDAGEAPTFDDGCGVAESVVNALGGCWDIEEEENRMCEACPLEMTFDTENTTVCLMGNMLVPVTADNVLWTSTTGKREAQFVYLESPPQGGCAAADYAPYAGQIVAIKRPVRCFMFDAALAATRAGVRAILFIGDSKQTFTQLVEGYSAVVRIAAHSVAYRSVLQLVAVAERYPLVGSARIVNLPFTLKKGALPPYVTPQPPPPPPPIEEEEEVPDLEFNASVVISFVFIGLLTIALLVYILHQRNQNLRYKESIGPLRHIKGFTLPLVVISSAVSLSFLAAMAAVAFQLAYSAGKDSTDTAILDGQEAVETQYQSSSRNIDILNNRWRDILLSRATENVVDFFKSGKQGADGVGGLLRNFDGTFDSFFPLYHQCVGHMLSSQWQTAIRTAEGFFMNAQLINPALAGIIPLYFNDYRPLSVRLQEPYVYPSDRPPPGQPDLAQVNNGYLYNYIIMDLIRGDGSLKYHRMTERSALHLMDFIGANYRNATDLVSDVLPGGVDQPVVWLRSQFSVIPGPGYAYSHPVTMLVPLFDKFSQLRGTFEFSRDLSQLNRAVQQVGNTEGGENVTTIVLDEDGTVYSSKEDASTPVAVLWDYIYWRINQTLTSRTLRAVELNAFGHYIKNIQLSAGESNVGTFNQETHYKEDSPWTVLHFDFNGNAEDRTMNKLANKLEGATLAQDTERGGVLQLTGTDSMVIFWNLTTDLPEIEPTRTSLPGAPWQSSEFLFTKVVMSEYGKETLMFSTLQFPIRFDRNMLWTPTLERDSSFAIWIKPSSAVNDTATPMDGRDPLLLSDSDAPPRGVVRFYANGVLKVGVTIRGCVTDPIPGGPQVGEWTHMAFTVNRDERKCRVYVNGQLHSIANMRMSVLTGHPNAVGTTGEPYRIGKGFQGMVDDVQLVNTSLSAVEMKTWMDSGAVQLHAPRKIWAYNMRKQVIDGFNTIPLRIGVLVPEEDILRRVNEENAITRRNLNIQETNTRKRLDQERNESILVLICVALASALVFMMFNAYITGPVTHVAELLVDIASFRVSEIEAQHSLIAEISAISEAMAVVCRNLKEFKSYIPKSLCLDEDETEEEEVSSAEESTHHTISKRSGGSKSMRSMRSSKSMSEVSAGNRAAQAKKAALMGTLQKKKITVGTINIVNFNEHTNKMPDKELIDLHGSLVAIVLKSIGDARGVADTFAGDRFNASWNAIKACGGHKGNALASVLEIRDKFLETPQKFAITGALTSGEARVGNMGTEGMKRFSFMTSILSYGIALERYARHLDVGLVAENSIVSENETVIAQAIGSVMCKKRSGRPILIFLLEGMAGGGEMDEWMYEMENMKNNNPYVAWNTWVTHIVKGEWEPAKAIEEDAKKVAAKGSFGDELQKAAARQEYNPFDLFFG